MREAGRDDTEVMRSLMLAACLLCPAPAAAQWMITTYLGGNYTRPSTITFERPDQQTSLEFLDVGYDARPMQSPQYYGARLARYFGGAARIGAEVEFLHIKVIARTEEMVHVRGTFQNVPVDATLPMQTFIWRYNHTHGLNFLFANVLWRAAATERAALVLRAGAGPIRPGRDVVTPDLNVQGYQFAGFGAQIGAGVDVRLKKRFGAMIEYKLTHASPELDLTNGGKGRMTALTHNLAAGLTIELGTMRQP
jgi:hypothetical protein